MATYTQAEFLNILELLSESKLSSKQFAKKATKIHELLKNGKPYEKVMNECRSMITSEKGDKPKKPQNAWQLFVAEYRKEHAETLVGQNVFKVVSAIWNDMSEDEKGPYILKAETLKNEMKSVQKEISSDVENVQPSDDENVQASDDENVQAPDDEKVQASDDENVQASDDENVQESDGVSSDSDGELKKKTKTKKNQKKKKADTKSKSKKDVMGECEYLMGRDMIRYQNDEGKFFEYVQDGNKCLMCRGTVDQDDTKFKYTPKVMKSDTAVNRAMEKMVNKVKEDGYELVC